MQYEDLLLEKKDGIATITLNVPDKLNALTQKMRMNLPLVTGEIAKDDDIRVVVVTGAGRGFCSGADVSSMSNRAQTDVTRYVMTQVTGWPHADVFARLEKPVIAAINGACVGGGFSLALSCDIRIASETARFGAAQVSRGLVPDYGMTHYLPRTVGMAQALELIYTAEIIGAADALKFGIVSRVVPPDKLMPTAYELAAKICKLPPVSLALAKKIVWQGMFDSLERQLSLESWAQRICYQTEDHQEAVRSFLEKRPPQPFKGR